MTYIWEKNMKNKESNISDEYINKKLKSLIKQTKRLLYGSNL